MSALIRAQARRGGKTTALLQYVQAVQDDSPESTVLIVTHNYTAAERMVHLVAESEIDPSRVEVHCAETVLRGSLRGRFWDRSTCHFAVDEWTLIRRTLRHGLFEEMKTRSDHPLFITADERDLLT